MSAYTAVVSKEGIMNRWSSFGIGAATFAVVQLIETAMWRQWFDVNGLYPPWFLNNGRAVTLVAISLFIAAVVSGATGGRAGQAAIRSGCWLAAGAFVAMAVVLLVIGPGTIFPMVLVFGALLAGVSSIAGTLVGTMMRLKSS